MVRPAEKLGMAHDQADLITPHLGFSEEHIGIVPADRQRSHGKEERPHTGQSNTVLVPGKSGNVAHAVP